MHQVHQVSTLCKLPLYTPENQQLLVFALQQTTSNQYRWVWCYLQNKVLPLKLLTFWESLLQVIVLVRVVLKYPLTLSSLELSCSRLPLERSKAKNEGDTSLLGGLCRPTVTWLQVSATPGDTWQSIERLKKQNVRYMNEIN